MLSMNPSQINLSGEASFTVLGSGSHVKIPLTMACCEEDRYNGHLPSLDISLPATALKRASFSVELPKIDFFIVGDALDIRDMYVALPRTNDKQHLKCEDLNKRKSD